MPSTFFGLNIGRTGLYASQAGLNTTAHNIANTETTGYSRQVINQKAGDALRVNSSYGMAGTGVNVTGVEQIRNKYYDAKYLVNSALSGEYSTKGYYMGAIENYFNEIQSEGFTTTFDNMYNSLQELSKSPADLSVRTQVTSYGQSFCDYFTTLSESLESMQKEANFEIKNQVERINSIGEQISVLNKQINSLEIGEKSANDLRDQRNNLVDELSEYVNVTVQETPAGVGMNNYVVKINNKTFVSSYEYDKLKVVPREHKVNQTDAEGLYDITWNNGQGFEVDNKSLGGKLYGLFQVRDGNNAQAFSGTIPSASAGDTLVTISGSNINSIEKLTIASEGSIKIGNIEYTYNGFQVKQDAVTGGFEYEFSLDEPLKYDVTNQKVKIGDDIDYKGVPYYMGKMTEFVRTYAKAFNDIHTSGEDLNGDPGLDFFTAKDSVTGEDYIFEQTSDEITNGVLFSSKTGDYKTNDTLKYGSYYMLNISNFAITKEVIEDPKRLVTGTSITDGIESADLVQKLVALKDDQNMFNKGKPASFLQSFVAEIGIDTSKATNFATNQEDVLSSIMNQRLSISGVDSEEEAMSLIRYQNAYQLSAKVISVLDEVYDRLINYMGA